MERCTRIYWAIFILLLSLFLFSCKDGGGSNLANFTDSSDSTDSSSDSSTGPSTLDAIVIFRVDPPVQGDFGSTNQIDCESAKSGLGLAGNNVKPFISIGSASEIKDIPGIPQTGVPVASASNIQLKSDWSSLWTDDFPDVSLFAAGVFASSSDTWWSGTYNNGTTGGGGANNCNNWTNTGAIGQFGNADQVNQTWIWDSSTDSCTVTKYRLCVAWD